MVLRLDLVLHNWRNYGRTVYSVNSVDRCDHMRVYRNHVRVYRNVDDGCHWSHRDWSWMQVDVQTRCCEDQRHLKGDEDLERQKQTVR